jgi:hypothetical protein
VSGRHATRAEAAVKTGNPAAVLMQRKCSCGTHAHGPAQCPACAALGPGEEAHQALRIGPPGDRLEREADRIAEHVMRSPLPGAESGRGRAPSPPEAGQRISTLGTGRTGSTVPAMLGTSGRALDRGTRERMETRFGHDFSKVRVHTGARAARSARSVGARAYTMGQHIVFGNGEFAPGTKAGQHLLAHELTHTIQQGHRSHHVQRLLKVQPNAAATAEVLGLFNNLCGGGNFAIQGTDTITSNCNQNSPGCDCLCDVTTSPSTFIVELFNVSNNPATVTLHDGSTQSIPMPSEGPRTTSVTSNPVVHIPFTASTALLFGVFADDGTPFMADSGRLLAHELCGHARFGMSYSGSTGKRPGHDPTIQIENSICAPPKRGLYNSTRQGESFHQPPVSNAKKAFRLVDGWHYEHVP